MLPPLLLDIEYHHYVFDMCAAPGSKTSQMIEMMAMSKSQLISSSSLGRQELIGLPKGLLVANDADNKRAYLLTH
jgi:tRNA (cytosine34-C5)-methyltransferase